MTAHVVASGETLPPELGLARSFADRYALESVNARSDIAWLSIDTAP